MDASAHFKGKKITVMGLGLLGRGLGDVRYLTEQGAELTVTDLKTAEQLESSLEALKDVGGITYIIGEHRLEDFRDRDFILKAAGVPLDSPYIAEAKKHGIPVKMSASWFAELAGIPVVGVTGTRGKSTVTHLIHAIYEQAGKPTILGGNVRGVSTLALLPEATPAHTAILELDSWQLQGFGDAELSPHIAVFTTFFPDHLNYYQNDIATYLGDKAQIFLHQKPGDTLVLGTQIAGRLQEEYAGRIKGRITIASETDLPAGWTIKMPGRHNRYNAALAIAAARAAGIDEALIRTAVEAFAGVPGRLSHVRTVDGIAYYNDTNSTTPEATVVALEALNETYPGRIVLITGGADKKLDMQAYLQAVRGVKHATLLAGTGTDRIKEALPECAAFGSLPEALADARAHAASGDVILLSPGFASFGMFKNEYDRGDQFDALVNAL